MYSSFMSGRIRPSLSWPLIRASLSPTTLRTQVQTSPTRTPPLAAFSCDGNRLFDKSCWQGVTCQEILSSTRVKVQKGPLFAAASTSITQKGHYDRVPFIPTALSCSRNNDRCTHSSSQAKLTFSSLSLPLCPRVL